MVFVKLSRKKKKNTKLGNLGGGGGHWGLWGFLGVRLTPDMLFFLGGGGLRAVCGAIHFEF